MADAREELTDLLLVGRDTGGVPEWVEIDGDGGEEGGGGGGGRSEEEDNDEEDEEEEDGGEVGGEVDGDARSSRGFRRSGKGRGTSNRRGHRVSASKLRRGAGGSRRRAAGPKTKTKTPGGGGRQKKTKARKKGGASASSSVTVAQDFATFIASKASQDKVMMIYAYSWAYKRVCKLTTPTHRYTHDMVAYSYSMCYSMCTSYYSSDT